MGTLFYLLVLALAVGVAVRRLTRMRPADYADADTVLALERYFSGHLRGWGVQEDRFGRVRRQFRIDSSGHLQGAALRIDQTLVFDTGASHQRIWSFQRQPDGRYLGTANDVVGEATGSGSGNTITLRYTVRQRLFGVPQRAQVEDWMFLQPGGVVIERARLSKWGCNVGQISAFYLADA